MWKALQIAGLLELPATHHRRKSQNLGVRLALARDQAGETFDDLLVEAGACVDTVRAHRAKQRIRHDVERVALLDRSLECNVHLVARLLRIVRLPPAIVTSPLASVS